MYRYFLDGILLLDEPKGWDQLVTSLKRDRILKGIIKTIDTSLIFGGDGYDYLLNLLDTNSFCAKADLQIQKSCDGGNTYQLFYDGIIFISDVEFDKKRCLAKSKIQDNSFYAKIYNNKSQEWLPFVATSKNGDTIATPTTYFVAYFDPQSGIYYPILSGAGEERTCAAYRVYDVLKFAIAFMTDDTIDFDSVTFGSGGEWDGLMLTSGMAVQTVGDGLDVPTFEETFPKMTFEKLFVELDRKLNIGFYVDYTTARPTVYIESDKLMRNSSNIMNAHDIDELKLTTAVDYLYSTLLIGGNNFNNDPLLHFPWDIDFVGFKSETYNILGACNIDRQLDLSYDYIVDTNAIESAVLNGDSTFEDEIFLISSTFYSGTTYRANATNTLIGSPVPPYYYNEDFTNEQIAKRYLGSIPNSIAIYLGNTDHKFRAEKTDGTLVPVGANGYVLEPIPYQDDTTPPNFDANAKYNPATYEYEIAQGGQYTFYSLLHFVASYNDAFDQDVIYNLVLREYDSAGFAGGVLLNSYTVFAHTLTDPIPNFPTNTATYVTIDGSVTVNTLAGNKFVMLFNMTRSSSTTNRSLTIYANSKSIFSCTNNITGGGIYQTYNPNDYSVLLSKFEYPFTDSNYANIMANIRGTISYNRNGDPSKLEWIEVIKFNHFTNKMDITLNANKTINGN